MSSLPVLQYPRTQNAVITVSTTYYGADPDVIAGFITTPLENAILTGCTAALITSPSPQCSRFLCSPASISSIPAPRASSPRRRTRASWSHRRRSRPTPRWSRRWLYAQQVYQIMRGFPATEHVFQINSPATVVGGMVLKPWDARARTSNALQPLAQQKFDQVAGARIAAFQLPPLPGSQGLPIQFVIKTTDPFDRLDDASQQFLKAAIASGLFIFLDTDLKIDNPEAVVEIDRDKASQLGLKMSDVGTAMGSMLGGGYVNYFSLDQRSYKVIPQVERRYRLNTDQLLNYYVANVSGTPVPLSTIAKISTKTVPETLNHFQQLNSATIQGVAAPGVAQSDALDFLNDSPPGRCRAATASITAHCPGNTSRSRRASWRRSASPW
jgi:multidrug efflux pump subunit AcrB